jgi:zinc protease
MRVVVVEDRSQPLVSMSLVFKQGAAAETIWGAANLATSLLTKGTQSRTHSRSAQEVADEIDFTGGSLGASAGFDSTSVNLSVLSAFLPKGLELLGDVVFHPAFAPEELERLRAQTLVEVQQYLSDAGYLAAVAFTQGMFRGTPYGHPVIGTVGSVQALTREDCLHVYNTLARPEHAFIAAAGDVDVEEFTAQMETLFGSWHSGDAGTAADAQALLNTQEQRSQADGSTTPKVMLIEKPDAAQTALRMGFPTAHRADEDFIAVQFLNTILGGSFISRLNHNLREQKGYTYGVHSGIDAYKSLSVWTCRSHVGSEVAGAAVSEIMRELETMHRQPISDDELETTRNYMLGSFALRTETPTQVVSLLSALEIFGLPDDYYERYFAEIAAMTKERLFEVQQRRFAAEGLVIAASGNVEQLHTQLGSFGSVHVVSAASEIVEEIV